MHNAQGKQLKCLYIDGCICYLIHPGQMVISLNRYKCEAITFPSSVVVSDLIFKYIYHSQVNDIGGHRSVGDVLQRSFCGTVFSRYVLQRTIEEAA